jgi:hypothetical protein
VNESVTIWIGAIVTIIVLSYVFKDNPAYRVIQHAALGVAVAFTLVITWQNVLYPNWLSPILTGWDNLKQGEGSAHGLWWLLALIPGSLWYFQLSRRYYWLSTPITGLFVGVAAGLAFKVQIMTVMPQIAASIKPLNPWTGDGAAGLSDYLTSANNLLFLVILFSSLMYFFFAIRTDHAALRLPIRFGRLAIMTTLGGMFACTVMTRVAYLIERLMVVYNDWLQGLIIAPLTS